MVNAKTLPPETFSRLSAYYGPQNWWPAEHAFEVILGAILTQNTSWSNVELALDNLRHNKLLSYSAVLAISLEELQAHIRPAGFYRRKSDCIHAVCRWLQAGHGIESLKTNSLHTNRLELLVISGIGEETADAILLYALDKPSFVIDKYTRRIFNRLGLPNTDSSYAQFQTELTEHIEVDVKNYQEYHALLVNHAKSYCQKSPQCSACPLNDCCGYYHKANTR